MHEAKCFIEQPSGADFIMHKLTDGKLDVDCKVNNLNVCGDRFISGTDIQVATLASKGDIQVWFLHAGTLFS